MMRSICKCDVDVKARKNSGNLHVGVRVLAYEPEPEDCPVYYLG
jgi:hypothetical protein